VGISSQPDEQGFYPVLVEVPETVKLLAVTPQRVRLK
jgi:hypothetical protein